MTTPLSLIIYGDSGAGKSTLANTAPGPRLIVDAEGAAHHAHRVVNGKIEIANVVKWKPGEPIPDNVTDTCSFRVQRWQDVQFLQDSLAKGDHPFRSLIVDSVTEIQQQLLDSIAREQDSETLRIQDWGTARKRFGAFVKETRNMAVDDDSNPLEVVVYLALPTLDADKRVRPDLQGKAIQDFPPSCDIVGVVQLGYTEDGETVEQRFMIGGMSEKYVAKTRSAVVRQEWGSVITNPNIEAIHNSIQPE